MSEPVNCPHQSTMNELHADVRKVLENQDRMDRMLRGDGESVGLVGRMAAVEKQVNERAEDSRVTKQTVVGGLILAILTSIGAAAFSVFAKNGAH